MNLVMSNYVNPKSKGKYFKKNLDQGAENRKERLKMRRNEINGYKKTT